MHVVSPDFGVGISSEELVVSFLDYFKSLKSSDVKMDGYTVDLLLRECYEYNFGITNFDDDSEPLAIIQYTNADTLGDLGSISELIKQYRTNEIGDKYGLSILDYFATPIDIAKLLVSNAKVEKQDMDDIVDTADKNANKEWGKRKKQRNR